MYIYICLYLFYILYMFIYLYKIIDIVFFDCPVAVVAAAAAVVASSDGSGRTHDNGPASTHADPFGARLDPSNSKSTD